MAGDDGNTGHFISRMGSWKKRGGSLSSWKLILVIFVLKEVQTGQHRHEFYFTAVGTTSSLLDFTMVSFIDDIHLCSYHKRNQTGVKMECIPSIPSANFSEQMQSVLMKHEEDFHRLICYLEQNDTKSEESHILQLFVDCQLEDDIQMDSHVQLAWDGEDLSRRDEQRGYWIFLKPMGYSLKHGLESAFWETVRKNYMQEYCYDLMRRILRYSRIKENVPPEVTVSRHDALDGTITLSCTATGFYPHSILLGWEKGNEHAPWGKQSSSGTLPNADGTFYLQVTLELLPGDPGTGYTCVVEHTELKAAAVYPVPGKPNKEKPWATALTIMIIVILAVSCALASITRKERKAVPRKPNKEKPWVMALTIMIIVILVARQLRALGTLGLQAAKKVTTCIDKGSSSTESSYANEISVLAQEPA